MPQSGCKSERFNSNGFTSHSNIPTQRPPPDPEDPRLIHALKTIPEKGFKVLRVIYNESTQPVTVVTVFFE